MINLNEEVLAKAKQAKSVEELVTLAKESGIEMTAGQVQGIFAQLHQASGELADDELSNVAAGGGCYSEDGYPIVTAFDKCDLWVCSGCGGTETKTIKINLDSRKICINCRKFYNCLNCRYCVSRLCTNPSNRK